MPLFRLSTVVTFVQGNQIQPFNPFGENRPKYVACRIRQYPLNCGQKSLIRWKFSSIDDKLNMSEQEEIRRR
jgi:hypothetical protein